MQDEALIDGTTSAHNLNNADTITITAITEQRDDGQHAAASALGRFWLQQYGQSTAPEASRAMLWPPALRVRRVDGEDLADNEPIEQHPDRSEMQLANWLGGRRFTVNVKSLPTTLSFASYFY
jgi:hypothetical protein